MVERAKAFTAVADEAKNHTAKLHEGKMFAQQELVDEVKKALAEGKPYNNTRIFKTIPVVAGWMAAEEAAERENILFQIVAEKARNQTHKPQTGTFRAELLSDLTSQVASGKGETIHRIDPATNQLHFMRAIRLTADCMSCHGIPGGPDDPDKDGKDILGFTMEGWKTGDMHGAYEVTMPMAPVQAEVRTFVAQGLLWTLPLVIGAVLLLVWLFNNMFSKPLAKLIQRISEIEKSNDLTLRVKMLHKDEIGLLGQSFNGLVVTLHDIIAKVSASAQEVAGAATEIAASSEEMSAGMKDQTNQVIQISAAVEEMSASIVEVARKSVDAAGSAESSGKSAEHGGSVVRQTIDGMKNINDAVRASASSVEELGNRGQEIGRIIQVINDIADQTNLLALNAAIEAARAGEHGRGFA
ncbi:MAG: methyl-accepting chemotaxis protein, partial [Phycisphaerales bacterium]|nr:methyl-accepting chemotaxis protein [Phycisphaerales bacterium]